MLATGLEYSPRITRSPERVTAALCEPVTASIVWQKNQVTPLSFCGTDARFVPSVVAPSSSAMGAWHCTQKLPS